MTVQQNKTAAASAAEGTGEARDFVTFTVRGQLFGIPVLTVQDVLAPQKITRIPLASTEVAGALNLRGRIVTAIDVRKRLGIRASEDRAKNMSIVVDYGGELYSLIIDTVGEVISVPMDCFEHNPATLDSVWREISAGVFRLDKQLLVVLDVARLLDFRKAEAA